jgi:acyl-coenzyme A thioesterase PaaI-like protein
VRASACAQVRVRMTARARPPTVPDKNYTAAAAAAAAADLTAAAAAHLDDDLGGGGVGDAERLGVGSKVLQYPR